MLPRLATKGRPSLLISVCALMMATSAPLAAADGVALDEASMMHAIRYLDQMFA